MTIRWFAVAVLAFGCKQAPPEKQQPPGSASAGSAVPIAVDAQVVAAPTWTAKSEPIALMCGDKPLVLPPRDPAAKPGADRRLSHADGIAVCRDQATVAATCTCLAASIGTWGPGLSGSGDCKPVSQASDAQIVEVASQPADADAKSGGEALVLVAKHGAKWSAVAVVDSEPDINLADTPHMTEHSAIAKFEAHPLADGELYWVVSQTETQDKSMGDVDHDGRTRGTICVAPTNPNTPAFCYTPLELGTWMYSFTAQDSTCAINKVTTHTATLDGTAATLRLDHGSDSDGLAGRYLF